jgi:hypothetical protein
MLLGYVIWGKDNKYNMYKGLKLDECAKYKDVYSVNTINPALQFNIKTTMTATYDGFVIVKEVFRKFCEDGGYSGLEFVELAGKEKYYWFKIHNIVGFDVIERETRFINFDEKCNGYEEVIGASPAYLKDKTVLPDGFFRTDIFFGSYASKFPLYIVGQETKKKMKDAGLDGITFEEILDKYDSK